MDQYQEIVSLIALTLGVSWASGVNLYAAMATLGIMGATGNADLPVGLQMLENPLVIGAAGLMFAVEFFADKVPGLDSLWDAVHTFIRIPGGAMLAMGAVGDANQGMELAAAIMGGSMAAGSHLFKSGSRAIINTSPEPVTNWTASITEDAAVVGGMWAALHHPYWFLGALLLFVLLAIWLLPKIWRGIKRVFAAIGRLFGAKPATPPGPSAPGSP